ncbi:uncharacterized protein LOC107364388 [Tetranychus urticae]|uniref:FAR1 domain-containing protein n=1 Tax=Tetranychus urticae TaxID=32264 RepID=T1KJ22_TETUR|nr:uncharacterized protein LOC107364388 [Tetranychus urticae]
MDCGKLDLNSLQLKLYAEFDQWQDFVAAVDEFQRKTSIKLTITTSRKLKSRVRGSKKRKTFKKIGEGVPEEDEHEQDHDESIDSSGDLNDDESQSQEGTTVSIKGFEYQYLKLTCKHYGGYRSTSKGIRPNQRTAKLMCPTYIYACFDHYKQKFIIKQMVVDCNHELKDEHVLISKLFKDKDADNISSDTNETTPKKKYVKVRNRNVLKIPLESPAVSNYVPSPTVRIKCNHELSESCEAASLTSEDLHSIHELFIPKSKKEQNDLILEWIQVLPYAANTVQVLFRLPAFDGSLVRVCYKSFSQVLKVAINRINELIIANYDEFGNFLDKNKQSGDSREIENCIANILTSFSKEGDSEDTHQVIYCDTVDVPYAEDTIEESFVEENINNMIETPPSCKNESRDTVQLLNPLKPPVIKVSPSGDKFFLEINCEYSVTLQNVSIENGGKTIKVSFSAK